MKRKRLELEGRNRAQLILNSGGVSGKSQESKQRAATKRDVNVVMERSVRVAVASVTVGAGDEEEVWTDPFQVARECCEWSDRRMSLMQPKWFRRLGPRRAELASAHQYRNKTAGHRGVAGGGGLDSLIGRGYSREERCINHPAKGPATPGSILSRCPLVFMLQKRQKIF